MSKLDKLISKMVQEDATRVILHSDQPLCFEIAGQDKTGPVLSLPQMYELVREIAPEHQLYKLSQGGQLQFQHQSDLGIFQISVVRGKGYIRATINGELDSIASESNQDQWHFVSNGKKIGPLKTQEVHELIHQNKFSRDNLVWCHGMSEWKAARDTSLHKFFPPLEEIPVAPSTSTTTQPEPPPVPGGKVYETSNGSGLGDASILPSEFAGFNLGAFFLPLPWALSHSVGWLKELIGWSFLVFVIIQCIMSVLYNGANISRDTYVASYFLWGCLGLLFASIAGFTGNAEAWKKCTWGSREEFKSVQSIWAWWGVSFFGLCTILPLSIITSLD